MTAYTVIATFVVHEHTDEHLQTEQAIKDEITSWLESLRATVQKIEVTR